MWIGPYHQSPSQHSGWIFSLCCFSNLDPLNGLKAFCNLLLGLLLTNISMVTLLPFLSLTHLLQFSFLIILALTHLHLFVSNFLKKMLRMMFWTLLLITWLLSLHCPLLRNCRKTLLLSRLHLWLPLPLHQEQNRVSIGTPYLIIINIILIKKINRW